MREIQALDPTVDPDQAIRTPCAPAAPAVPKAPAAPATPAAAQALKLTDAAARLGEALCGVPTERNPSTPHTRGCTPGWYAVPRWGTHLDDRHSPGLCEFGGLAGWHCVGGLCVAGKARQLGGWPTLIADLFRGCCAPEDFLSSAFHAESR